MTTPTHPTERRGNRIFQMRFSMLMVIIAGVAGICAAGRFYLANQEIPQSMISQQLQALTAGEPKARRDAASLLDAVAPEELSRVAPALMAAMHDTDPAVRAAATQSLAQSVRRYYRMTKGEIPPELEATTRLLVARLEDPDATVRESAAQALGTLGVTHAKSGKTTLLGQDPSRASDALRVALNDRDPAVASAACQALISKLGTAPATILPALRRLAREADSGGRSFAVHCLANVDRAQGAPPDEILAFLDDRDHLVRKAAATSLRTPWRDPDRVAVGLAGLLNKCEPRERMDIVVALSTIRPLPDAAVPAVLRAMESEDLDIQDRFERQNILDFSAIAIGNAMPATARAAIPALVKAAMRQARESGSTTAITAIYAIDPQHSAIPNLIEPLAAAMQVETSPEARISQIEILTKLGPEGEAVALKAMQALLTKP